MVSNHVVNFLLLLCFSRFSAALGQIRPAAIIIIIQTLTFFPIGESRFLWQKSIHISTNAYIGMVACICIKLEKEQNFRRGQRKIRTLKIFLEVYLPLNSCPMGRLPFERLTLRRFFPTSPKKGELIFPFSLRL